MTGKQRRVAYSNVSTVIHNYIVTTYCFAQLLVSSPMLVPSAEECTGEFSWKCLPPKEAAKRTADGTKNAADKTKDWGKKTFNPNSPAATTSNIFSFSSLGLASALYYYVCAN